MYAIRSYYVSHPRSNGTFAKVLRSYVRERGLMSMQEALRKMSLMPAPKRCSRAPVPSTRNNFV